PVPARTGPKTLGPKTNSRAAGPSGARRPMRPLARSQPSVPVVPPQAVAGRALILVVAIMGFLACLAFGVLTLVSDAARSWQLDVSREVTIQLKPVDGVPVEANLQAAMAVARETDGVRDVRLLSERDSARLLEPWLGAGLDLSGLPVPRLIVLELADPAATDLVGLRSRLAREVRGAVLDDHSVWAARLRTMAGTMVVAGWLVVILVLSAMVLSVVFATRAAMAGNRDVIEVLHFVGAEDGFVAREFQRHFLLLGLQGGAAGGLTAMLAFAVADWITRVTPGTAASDQAQALFGGFSVGWTGYLGAVGIVALVAALTAVTSRLTVRSYLNQMD
ncbi:ABC transporter permease, partial [Prosthecomicrobium hirschii]